MIKSIIGFGDSWIYGDGINPDNQRLEYCILGQIGKKLNLPVDNRGRSGAGITSVQWDFSQWALSTGNLQEHLVIIGIPSETRESWWDNDPSSQYQYHESVWRTESTHKWHDFCKHFLLHSDCDKLQQLRYWQGVNYFDSYCFKHNIPLMQINVFEPTVPCQVDSLFHSKQSMIDLIRREQASINKQLTSECHHANKDGAEWLANIFVNEIKKRNLAC